MKRLGLQFIIFILATAFISACGPIFTMPEPTGMNSIGTIAVDLTDTAHMDARFGAATSPRRLMVHCYYPAKAEPNSKPVTYFPVLNAMLSNKKAYVDTLAEQFTSEPWPSIFGLLQYTLGTHTFEKAPITSGKFPVIVFSHGVYGTHFFHMATIEELVSQGFVVVAIEHTFSNIVSQFPDGKILGPNPLPSRLDEVNIRADDVKFVIDSLRQNKISLLANRVDLKHVGVLGHSMGAATALLAGSKFSDSIQAVAALDGGGNGAVLITVPQPLIFLLAGVAYTCQGESNFLTGPNKSCNELSGVYHNAFLDFSVMRDFFSYEWYRDLLIGQTGPQGNTAFIRDINTRLVTFFKKYLAN